MRENKSHSSGVLPIFSISYATDRKKTFRLRAVKLPYHAVIVLESPPDALVKSVLGSTQIVDTGAEAVGGAGGGRKSARRHRPETGAVVGGKLVADSAYFTRVCFPARLGGQGFGISISHVVNQLRPFSIAWNMPARRTNALHTAWNTVT